MIWVVLYVIIGTMHFAIAPDTHKVNPVVVGWLWPLFFIMAVLVKVYKK